MSERARYRGVFAFPEFRAIFLAHIISMAGTVLAQLALTVLVYARSRSALLSALTFATAFLPQIISGTLLSAVVDRVPARRLLTGCSAASAIAELAMALPADPVPVLLILSFALGVIQPVFQGARAVTLREVLTGDAYVPGRSLIRLVSQAAQVSGFAVGGMLLTVASPRDLLLGDAASFGIAALLLRLGTRARALTRSAPDRPPLLQDSLAGVRAVLAVPPLRRILLLTWAVAALTVMPAALMVPYAADRATGTTGLGLLLTAGPLGMVVGEVVAVWAMSAVLQVRAIRPAMALVFVPLLLFVVRPAVPLAVTALFASGLGAAACLGLDRLVLEFSPSSLLPRTLSLQSAGLMFWQAIGYAVAGASAGLAAPSTVITMAAGCGLLMIAAYTAAAVGPARWLGNRIQPGTSRVRPP